MTWRLIVVIVAAGYVLALMAFSALMRFAAEAQAVDVFDLELAPPPRPCPVCTSSNVYVDTEQMCLCATCRSSFKLTTQVSP